MTKLNPSRGKKIKGTYSDMLNDLSAGINLVKALKPKPKLKSKGKF